MTIKSDAANLVKLYTNHLRAHRNLNNYIRNNPNNSLRGGVGMERRTNIGITEQALRRGAANIMRRHNIRSNRTNGGHLTGQAVRVFVPQLLRRLRFKHIMKEAGIPLNVINAYIRQVN
jgi:hypothetical protein